MKIKLLKTTELAQILRTSPGYIRNQIHLGKEGKTIPPSIQLGRRRMWLESDLLIWLQSKNSNDLEITNV